jgi:hypothetical protein
VQVPVTVIVTETGFPCEALLLPHPVAVPAPIVAPPEPLTHNV